MADDYNNVYKNKAPVGVTSENLGNAAFTRASAAFFLSNDFFMLFADFYRPSLPHQFLARHLSQKL